MKNSGMGLAGVLFTVLFIAVITIMAIKYLGVNDSGTGDETAPNPMEEARSVECLMKVQNLKTEIKLFKAENQRLPRSLDEVTDDSACPLTGEMYEYDEETGDVWCPDHS